MVCSPVLYFFNPFLFYIGCPSFYFHFQAFFSPYASSNGTFFE